MARKKKQPRSCVTCQNPITHSGKYCSRACNPKMETHCLNCKKELTNKEQFKFCSSSCSASVNNALFKKRELEGNCALCEKPCSASVTHCASCRTLYRPNMHSTRTVTNRNIPCEYIPYNQYKIALWLTDEWDGTKARGASATVRAYMLDIADYKCQMCGFNTPHPTDNSTILELDHIDGDCQNNTFSNLRVLCPNCHALTPSYRARNKGNSTRATHYLRVTKKA